MSKRKRDIEPDELVGDGGGTIGGSSDVYAIPAKETSYFDPNLLNLRYTDEWDRNVTTKVDPDDLTPYERFLVKHDAYHLDESGDGLTLNKDPSKLFTGPANTLAKKLVRGKGTYTTAAGIRQSYDTQGSFRNRSIVINTDTDRPDSKVIRIPKRATSTMDNRQVYRAISPQGQVSTYKGTTAQIATQKAVNVVKSVASRFRSVFT